MSWVINSTLDEELMSKMHTNSYRDELGGGKAVRKKNHESVSERAKSPNGV